MTDKEYMYAVHRMAQIVKILTLKMDEDAQELFEEYCELSEKLLKAEHFGRGEV